MDEENRDETLRVLVDLAMEDDPSSCFEGARALRLLRSQSSAEELRKIGIDEDIIKLIWSNENDG